MRLIVAEDAALLREGLVALLTRQDHEVIAQAATAPELETAVRRAVDAGHPPDVLITDVRMPPSMTHDGLTAAVRIRAAYPRIGILVLSQYVAPAYAAALFSGTSTHPTDTGATTPSAGGLGYLLKERIARVADFLSSLDAVAAGGIVVDPEVAATLVANRHSALDALSPREREVLELMAQGLSNPQMARDLVLSAGAIAKHVANIFTKLDLTPEQENRRVRAVLTYLTATRA